MRPTVAFALFAVQLAAQETTTGAIAGRILDPSGSAIAGAETLATRTDTGMTRRAKSGADGAYSFYNLPIGPYQISASHPGFKKSVETGITLHVSEHLSQDIVLQIGDVSHEVSVTSNAT